VTEGYVPGAYQGYPEVQGGYPAYQGYPQEGYPGGAYPQMQEGYPGGAYPGYPASPQIGYPPGAYPGEFAAQQPPRNVYVNPAMGPGFGNPAMMNPYGQMTYEYPQQMGYGPHVDYESSDMYKHGMQQPYPVQPNPLPVSTGGLADCGCGAPVPSPQPFVPTTPPVYMAPYSAPSQYAQPPFMNPYGMGPMGAVPYGMPRDDEENDENGN
ncbi:MAG: hypothetical protein Q8929_16795, partial [Bacillota bacterium]|nr:hypothetical protein [Bacillota bacterium]